MDGITFFTPNLTLEHQDFSLALPPRVHLPAATS